MLTFKKLIKVKEYNSCSDDIRWQMSKSTNVIFYFFFIFANAWPVHTDTHRHTYRQTQKLSEILQNCQNNINVYSWSCEPPRERSYDHNQIGVDWALSLRLPPSNQSEVGILIWVTKYIAYEHMTAPTYRNRPKDILPTYILRKYYSENY